MRIRFVAFRCLSSAMTIALLSCTAGTASAQFSISRFTVDGGGITNILGGTFTLGGTIGQAATGWMTGSSFTIGAGFWFGGSGTATAIENDPSGDGLGLPSVVPLAFRLYPAAPNPFAEQTVVAFDLPA